MSKLPLRDRIKVGEERGLVNREGWPPGPWDDEPDKVVWIDEQTDLPCMMVRNRFGAWCGYAGVGPGHPAFGVDYAKADTEFDLHAHGGLTYSDKCQESGGLVCHTVLEGEEDERWWFGFDCAHAYDVHPGALRLEPVLKPPVLPGGSYRDVAYVREQVTRLAQQLAEAAP